MAKYLVWCPELAADAEDGSIFEAAAPAYAAEAWAAWEDVHSSDYWIVGGETATVTVRALATGVESSYRVTGAQRPVYRAVEA